MQEIIATRPDPDIVLEMHICDQRRSYRVTFTGPRAEEFALAYVEARVTTHAVHELDDRPVPDQYAALLEWLHPACPHGLDLANCYGPQHYYFDEEEQSRGLRNGAW